MFHIVLAPTLVSEHSYLDYYFYFLVHMYLSNSILKAKFIDVFILRSETLHASSLCHLDGNWEWLEKWLCPTGGQAK